jgi:ABC-2 type transport system permease protein
LLAVAVLGFGVRLDAARLSAAVVAFLLGAGCFAALGLAVLALVRRSQTVIAVTLGTLLPLSFISDVFVIGARIPQPLAAIADVLPLKHAVHALRAALEPGRVGTGRNGGTFGASTEGEIQQEIQRLSASLT